MNLMTPGIPVIRRRVESFKTQRLLLRPWRPEDYRPFADLNADPQVMQYMPGALSESESNALATRIGSHFSEHGFGLWAVELVGEASFVGFVGLSRPAFAAHFTPCVEIAWRLARPFWERGIATEAARAVLRVAFEPLNLDEIVSFTVPHNLRSRRVMEKIGLQYDTSGDFEHPSLPEGHPLRRHVLYRLPRLRYFARLS